MELLQDSDSSSATIGPHWPSSYPEYLSPHQDKDEQRRIVWTRLQSQCSNLARRLSKQNKRYQALRQELNPRTTQVESSHDPLYRDISTMVRVFSCLHLCFLWLIPFFASRNVCYWRWLPICPLEGDDYEARGADYKMDSTIQTSLRNELNGT